MELYQLQYFQELCKVKSYRKAAERLMISQPAISIAIKKLEGELGGYLIDRSMKTFTLTPMGEALYRQALAVNGLISEVYREMNAYSSKQVEAIRVTFPDNILPELLKETMIQFTPQFPNIPLCVSRKGQAAIIEGLDSQEIDIGIVCADAVRFNPRINSRSYKEIELYAVFSQDHRLCGRERIPRELLAEEPLLIAKSGIMSSTIISYFQEGGIEPLCTEALDNDLQFSDAYKLASEGMGIAFIEKPGHRKIEYAPLDPPLKIEMAFAWPQKFISAKTIAMKKRIIDFLASI